MLTVLTEKLVVDAAGHRRRRQLISYVAPGLLFCLQFLDRLTDTVSHIHRTTERERGGKLETDAEPATKAILRQSSRPCKQTFIQKKNLTCLRQDLNTREAILTLLTRRKREEGTGCVRMRERDDLLIY